MDRRAYRYLRPYQGRLGVVLAICLVSTGLALYLPYLTRPLIDDALVGHNAPALWRILVIFIVSGAASFGLNVASGLRYTRVSAEILFDMRRDLYEHLQTLSPRFYATARLGDIVSRLNNDIGEIQRIVAETALAWVGNVLFLVGSVAMLVWLDWRLFLVGLVPLPLAAWALVRYRRRMEARTADLRVRSADIGVFLIETLGAMRTVVLAGAERREVSRFSRLNDAFIATLMGVQRVQYLAGGLPTLLLSAAATSVFVVGGWRVVEGTLTLGSLVAVMAYQTRLASPVQALTGLYNALATARVAWRRVRHILDTPAEVVERADAAALTDVEGDLAFENVSLSHGRGVGVLDRATFSVRRGETLAVVGASGSGKSTIADLAVRLLDPDAGVVRLDDRDIRTLRLADLRRHVRVVEQDPALFHGSIDDNVRYGAPEATDADIAMALAAAGLASLVSALPEQGRTMVGDRGLALSAGERQRIALARALVARPSVLVLDEPSAALDPVSERQIVEGYRRVMRGRTTVVISHRLEIVRDADRVIVIDGARVVQAGTPAELHVAGGAFAVLFGGGREPALRS